jgi:hypothetical protein
VKAQIIQYVKVSFGNAGDVTERFVGKKALLMIWLIYVTTAGTILKSWGISFQLALLAHGR